MKSRNPYETHVPGRKAWGAWQGRTHTPLLATGPSLRSSTAQRPVLIARPFVTGVALEGSPEHKQTQPETNSSYLYHTNGVGSHAQKLVEARNDKRPPASSNLLRSTKLSGLLSVLKLTGLPSQSTRGCGEPSGGRFRDGFSNRSLVGLHLGPR